MTPEKNKDGSPEAGSPTLRVQKCRHLLAPLQLDQAWCDRMQVRNYRLCSACGQFLWDDGSEGGYGPEASVSERAEGATKDPVTPGLTK